MKIDIVYLWVNGADPIWLRKRALAQQEKLDPKELAQYGNVAGRYRDNGELRYNLRALERFFPDHGHIYIVSDGQRPDWLKADADISFVDHASLIPAHARPVFDAGHIESYLHHIPNLSERFIYLNDDIFFGAPVQISDWFSEQGLAVFFDQQAAPKTNALQEHETALVNAAVLSKQWLAQQYADYQHQPWLCAHAPRPMLKSALWNLEQMAPDLFARVRSTTFRAWHVPPIISDLLLRWKLHTGIATAKHHPVLHISSGDPDAAQQFHALALNFGHIPFFCINDTCDDCPDDDPRLQAIANTLSALLAEPSQYEVSPAGTHNTSKSDEPKARKNKATPRGMALNIN
ncbi:stealth family protein [Chitinibacter sp. FCG-7]|uniref:Stealth family protein n=1 Tax=Chitinibacter mangrovi TaxID=3153927 RepID=A0AAU7F747_9NEIS